MPFNFEIVSQGLTCDPCVDKDEDGLVEQGEEFLVKDTRYGVRLTANHDEPQRKPRATQQPSTTWARSRSSITMSIGVVTLLTRASVMRRAISATIPTRLLSPNMKAVTSRTISRTGMLFQASVAPGSMNAMR